MGLGPITRPARTVTRGGLLLAAGMWLLLAGCGKPPPRSFSEFMEDDIAREGVIARCDQDADVSAGDIECANARRAALAVELQKERTRRKAYEKESERKLAALRDQIAAQQRAEQDAVAAAEAAAKAAYDAQWHDGNTVPLPPGSVPVEAAPGAADAVPGAGASESALRQTPAETQAAEPDGSVSDASGGPAAVEPAPASGAAPIAPSSPVAAPEQPAVAAPLQ